MNNQVEYLKSVESRLAAAGLDDAAVVGSEFGCQPFGNTAKVFRLGGLLLRVIQDRGQEFLDIAAESAPTEFHQFDDVGIAMGWKTVEQVLSKKKPDELADVLAELRMHLGELNDACSNDRLELTRARFARAARERGKLFADRLGSGK